MERLKKYRFLDGGTLKIIAIITMLADHIGALLFPQIILFRIIGRIAFPIFCFLLVEGFMHTRDVKKYALRLLLFAFISEIPFDLAFGGGSTIGFIPVNLYQQNVFFTLFLGLLALILITKYGYQRINIFFIILSCMLVASFLKTDYGEAGVLLIVLFYYSYGNILKVIGSVILFCLIFTGIQIYGILSLIPLVLYNGKKGITFKYVFYVFYPAHLLILYAIFLLVH